jgi:peptide deformylase
MILPIYAFGQPVLKKVASDIDKDYPNLPQLLEDMWETMYKAEGVGLAAPQVGLPIRLFIVDSIKPTEEDEEKNKKEPEEPGIKQVFINAKMIEETGLSATYEEGCLSIPDIKGDVLRQPVIRVRYLDENFEPHEETFRGINARIIQHEYDHIEGILFTERLKPIKRQLIKRKLEAIRQGKVKVDYKMKFAKL